MSGDPVPRATRGIAGEPRPGWLRRFRRELGLVVPEQDSVVRLIILERLVKSAVLVVLAISLVVASRLGDLGKLSEELQEQLNLSAGHGLIARVVDWVVNTLGQVVPHVTVLALAALAYAALETTEGIGLARRRRWAEYLTVVATGVLIPFEVREVVARPTVLRVGALLVNIAIVVYLAYRKRLFVDV